MSETNADTELVAKLQSEIQLLQSNNRQLQEVCCFLDADRQKTKQLSREWQKFGKYTADLMKQEITAYQQRLADRDGQIDRLLREVDELKRLCLYLDEQRQTIIAEATAMAEEACFGARSAGCSSTAPCSSDDYVSQESISQIGPISVPPDNNEVINRESETAIQRLAAQKTAQQPLSVTPEQAVAYIASQEKWNLQEHDARLFNYITSLESRIRSLEGGQSSSGKSSDISSEGCRLSVSKSETSLRKSPTIQILSAVDDLDATESKKLQMETSTSTMTSSGTTYYSSGTDDSAVTAVFVNNNHPGDDDSSSRASGYLSGGLEVRTLGPIDEEPSIFLGANTKGNRVSLSSSSTEESGIGIEDLPPKMPLMPTPPFGTPSIDQTDRAGGSSTLSLDAFSNGSSNRSYKSCPDGFHSLNRLPSMPATTPKKSVTIQQPPLRYRHSFNPPGHFPGRPVVCPKIIDGSDSSPTTYQNNSPSKNSFKKMLQSAWGSLERRRTMPAGSPGNGKCDSPMPTSPPITAL